MLGRLSSLLLFFAMIIAFSSCEPCMDGRGEIVSEVRELDNFSKLEIDVPAEIFIHVGEFPKVSIQTHENIIGKIETNVHSNTLTIESQLCIGSVKKLRIDLVVTDLNSISLNGSGNVKFKSQIKTDYFDVKVNGSGGIVIDLFANYVDAKINGSGNMLVKGTTKNLKVRINGSGDFRALDLQSFETSVKINGSGDAIVNSKNKLYVEISGSGSVKYKGASQKIKTNITGSGEVKKID